MKVVLSMLSVLMGCATAGVPYGGEGSLAVGGLGVGILGVTGNMYNYYPRNNNGRGHLGPRHGLVGNGLLGHGVGNNLIGQGVGGVTGLSGRGFAGRGISGRGFSGQGFSSMRGFAGQGLGTGMQGRSFIGNRFNRGISGARGFAGRGISGRGFAGSGLVRGGQYGNGIGQNVQGLSLGVMGRGLAAFSGQLGVANIAARGIGTGLLNRYH